MKALSYFPTRGWSCTSCSGVLAKTEYIQLSDSFRKDLALGKESTQKTKIQCSLCENFMNSFTLKTAKIDVEYCPRDSMLFFDLGEDEHVGRVYKRKGSPYKYLNPRGLDYAVSVEFAQQIGDSAQKILALQKAKNKPKELKKIIEQINKENSEWD